ncbi:MAG: hypothetical protein VYD87_11105 [Pseudomonadota bacterium]|nr:hypothetical protein [Pseudomonadota bacterium]MEE3100789.1 hypothetical protein [Pseudomonadota bacterium]
MAGELDQRIDGFPELTAEERRALRVLLRDERRARLAWRLARRVAVAVGTTILAVLAFWNQLATAIGHAADLWRRLF